MAAVEAELAATRKQLADVEADAERRVEAVKRQLTEAKTKAKAVIMRVREQADEKINLHTEQNRLQADELSQLKTMLRNTEHEKTTIAETSSLLQKELEELRVHVSSNDHNSEQHLNQSGESADAEKAEHVAMENRISTLENELLEAKQKIAQNEDISTSQAKENTERLESDSAKILQLTSKLEEANNQIATLELALSEKNRDTSRHTAKDTSEDHGSDEAMTSEKQLSHELNQSAERVGELQSKLENAQQEKRILEDNQNAIVEKLQNHNKDMEQKLRDAEDRIKGLDAEILKSETALQAEKNVVSNTEKTASESVKGSKEDKLILEAKLAEMERVVASKQAEIGKVREKAKTYLKELNAEKRDMESKMKQEAEQLRKEIADEQEKVMAAEQRADNIASELESCLVLIREKGKSVQMLRMSISTEKKAAMEAMKETETLRMEFSRYKERARITLQEKDNAVANSDEAVEAATSSLRKELEKSRKEMRELRSNVTVAEKDTVKYEELLNRAQRAEAAVDLLRADAKESSTPNYGKIDFLEEKISVLENELGTANSATEDAEARHETTKMRLEALEKALRSAELRAEEAGRVAKKTVDGLRTRISTLEEALERAQESSKAAQRTAAAAAKAMAFSSSPATEEDEESPVQRSPRSPEHRDRFTAAPPFNVAVTTDKAGSSFAAAMVGHSDSLGLKLIENSLGGSGDGEYDLSDGRLVAKEQEITVLTGQLAELGSLLEEAQQETELRSEQASLLKEEVRRLEAKLAAAERLQNGAPFSYLRTIVVRYLETDDATLLPVIANVLSFTKEESARIRECRSAPVAGGSQKSGYFSIPFLGSR